METRRTTRSSARAASASTVQPQIKDFFSVRRCPASRNVKPVKVATAAPAKPKTMAKKKELNKAVVTGETVKSEDFSKEVTPEQGMTAPKCRPKEEELVLSPESEPGPSTSTTLTAPSPRKKPRTENEDILAGFVNPLLDSKNQALFSDKNKYANLEKLTNDVRISSRLPLPKNMGKRIVFEDVRNDVEKHLKIAFTMDHFAQLLHAYPESYNVRLEKTRYTRGAPGSTSQYEYVIEPNLKNDVEGFMKMDLPKDT
uniref:CDT1 domain-containing protein n=1 Tax=Steinernema glaseri TaxID=37863 RepID=A0A1I7Z080_9BILA